MTHHNGLHIVNLPYLQVVSLVSFDFHNSYEASGQSTFVLTLEIKEKGFGEPGWRADVPTPNK